MSLKKLLIALLVAGGLLAGVVLAWPHLPRHYWMAQYPADGVVLSHGNECFIFIYTSTWGRSPNVVEEKLGQLAGGNAAVLLGYHRLSDDAFVYHYQADRVQQFVLQNTPFYGQYQPYQGSFRYASTAYSRQPAAGWRWTGTEFVPLTSAELEHAKQASAASQSASSGDDDDEDDAGVAAATREINALSERGWHLKRLGVFAVNKDRVYSIKLAGATLTLTLQKRAEPADRSFLFSAASGPIALAGAGLNGEQVLFRPQGWRQVSKEEYLATAARGRQLDRVLSSSSLLALLGLRFLVLLLVPAVYGLKFYRFFTMKSKLVKAVSGSYGYPAATPEQFPQLDRQKLDHYSAELERLGFEKLADFTLLPDSGTYIPSFARLFHHERNQCYAEVHQVFPPAKKPLPVTCVVITLMDDDWSLSTSNIRPLATGSLLRLPRKLSIAMPGAPASELLQTNLQRRQQIAFDLGVGMVRDTSAARYFAHSQRMAALRKEKLKQRNLWMGLGEVFVRRFQPRYEWMGDYPREAARRKEPWKAISVSGT